MPRRQSLGERFGRHFVVPSSHQIGDRHPVRMQCLNAAEMSPVSGDTRLDQEFLEQVLVVALSAT